MSRTDNSRRRFIKTTAYVAPALLTLKALPAFARNGSYPPKDHHGPGKDYHHGKGSGDHHDKKPGNHHGKGPGKYDKGPGSRNGKGSDNHHARKGPGGHGPRG